MNKDIIFRKLTSRKMWMAVCSFVSLVGVACGLGENEAAQISAIVMAGASVVAYIVGEGLVDASREGDSDGGVKGDDAVNGDGVDNTYTDVFI